MCDVNDEHEFSYECGCSACYAELIDKLHDEEVDRRLLGE